MDCVFCARPRARVRIVALTSTFLGRTEIGPRCAYAHVACVLAWWPWFKGRPWWRCDDPDLLHAQAAGELSRAFAPIEGGEGR